MSMTLGTLATTSKSLEIGTDQASKHSGPESRT